MRAVVPVSTTPVPEPEIGGPSLDGFREAQDRLRSLTGELVTFLGPVSVTFPPGTRLDPQTGRPYDPMIAPTASARASAVVKAGVVSSLDDGEAQPFGWTPEADVMLHMPSGAASAASADAFMLRGKLWQVTGRHFEGIGDLTNRIHVFGKRA